MALGIHDCLHFQYSFPSLPLAEKDWDRFVLAPELYTSLYILRTCAEALIEDSASREYGVVIILNIIGCMSRLPFTEMVPRLKLPHTNFDLLLCLKIKWSTGLIRAKENLFKSGSNRLVALAS
jgi:hypothetical protein